MSKLQRQHKGFVAGSAIGVLGGLVGLGGAEFRLPVLVGIFRLSTLKAVVLNKAMSLMVVASALVFRMHAIPVAQLGEQLGIVINLLAGSLVGAWWAAGHAINMSRQLLNRIIMVMLVGLAVLMLWEAVGGVREQAAPLFTNVYVLMLTGVMAGLLIGMVAALLGVAGGELLIPTIVLLYGVDIKLAGSLSLMVSLPTMIVGFARYRSSDAFSVISEERQLFQWMVVGSIIGAGIGGLLLGLIPTHLLMAALGVILLISAVKTFRHSDH